MTSQLQNSPHIACWRRDHKSDDRPSLDAEFVNPGSGVEVPDTDREIRPAGDQLGGIVSRVLFVRVQKTSDSATMPTQNTNSRRRRL